MSIYPLARVWDHSTQRGTALLLLLAMADRADELGVCWAGANWLAERARLERRQAIRTVQMLEQAEEIIVVRSRRPTGLNIVNHYIVSVGAPPDTLTAAHARVHELLDLRGGIVYDTSVTEDTTPSVVEDTRGSGQDDTRGRGTQTLGVVAGMSPDPSLDPLREEDDPLDPPPASFLWGLALDELEMQMTRATYRTWLRGTAAEWSAGELIIQCRSAAAVDWLHNRLRGLVERAVESAAGSPYPIRFEAAPA